MRTGCGARPPPEILALAYDDARRGGQLAALLQVQSPVRWKALCHSTGQAGHHDGSISSRCSCRSSDRAPADN
ncbi:hypothetical protein [Streptomyces sp. DSM 40750]|uniref:hypothetical protein n=1 Tax=Streptomyces sp. DSM 40750 TaxID=2801030 RepID=UPI003FA6DD59